MNSPVPITYAYLVIAHYDPWIELAKAYPIYAKNCREMETSTLSNTSSNIKIKACSDEHKPKQGWKFWWRFWGSKWPSTKGNKTNNKAHIHELSQFLFWNP